ncbi:hypothetical protein D3C78_1493140 [compost metagenome]
MNVADGVPTAIDLDGGGDDVLVTRPEAEVIVQRLPPGALPFIDALAAGAPVAKATGAALDEAPQFDLAGTLVGLLRAGAFVGWSLTQTTHGAEPGSSG